MYPCNINEPIDIKTESAAISRIVALRAPKTAVFPKVVVLCAPKSAANSKIFVSVHLKVLQFQGCLCSVQLKVLEIPGHEKGDVPRQEARIFLCNFRATFTDEYSWKCFYVIQRF